MLRKGEQKDSQMWRVVVLSFANHSKQVAPVNQNHFYSRLRLTGSIQGRHWVCKITPLSVFHDGRCRLAMYLAIPVARSGSPFPRSVRDGRTAPEFHPIQEFRSATPACSAQPPDGTGAPTPLGVGLSAPAQRHSPTFLTNSTEDRYYPSFWQPGQTRVS